MVLYTVFNGDNWSMLYRPGTPPLKPIKGSLKSSVLMVLYTVFNGEY